MSKELGTLTVPVVTILPGTASTGQLVSFNGIVYNYNGTAWVDISTTPAVAVTRITGSDATSASTTLVNTGLSWTATSGVTYEFEALLVYTSNSTTSGIRVTLSGATPTLLCTVVETQTTATSFSVQTQTAMLSGTATTTTDVVSTNRLVRVTGILTAATTGTVLIQMASSSTGTITVKKGSTLRIS